MSEERVRKGKRKKRKRIKRSITAFSLSQGEKRRVLLLVRARLEVGDVIKCSHAE